MDGRSPQEREQELRRVTRYSMYQPMFYRSNLWIHSQHLQLMVREIAPMLKEVYGDAFQVAKAVAMAAVHDDHEIIMGDFQAGNKAILSVEQTAQLEQTEAQAIEKTIQRFPPMFGPFSYGELLREANAANTLEAQVVKYLDKFDAYGEALHELYAGNAAFAKRVRTAYGEPPTPQEYYVEWFSGVRKKYPALAPLLVTDHSFFAPMVMYDPRAIVCSHQPHTAQTILQETDHPHYNAWKKLFWQQGSEEIRTCLIHQTEGCI